MAITAKKTARNTETGANKGKTYLSKYSDELLITEIESRGYMVIEVPQIEIPDLNFDDIEFDNIDLSSLNEFEDKLRQTEQTFIAQTATTKNADEPMFASQAINNTPHRKKRR